VLTHTPLHLVCPAVQVAGVVELLQTPAVHFSPVAHALPQLPQLAASVLVFTHLPLHAT